MVVTIPDNTPDELIWHVSPIDDLREHVTSGAKGQCWCHPRVEEEDSGYVVIHNSMDGREQYEAGERRPS